MPDAEKSVKIIPKMTVEKSFGVEDTYFYERYILAGNSDEMYIWLEKLIETAEDKKLICGAEILLENKRNGCKYNLATILL